jgi:tRNA threonylcarbamoyladenosine biosynthesis protein TsaB
LPCVEGNTLVVVLLAFDTATPLVTVALHDGHHVVAERLSEAPMKHAEQLVPLIEGVLDDLRCAPRELTSVAVGTGPGPFTGLRVGLVTARTLGYVLGLPVHGVCTLDVIAAEAAARATKEQSAGKPSAGRLAEGFLVATDARRKEVYSASYDINGRRTSEPSVRKPIEIATSLPVAGEGAQLYPDAFPTAWGPKRPSAGWLARVVIDGLAAVTDPEPRYLRRPDAAIPGAPKRVS